MSSVLIVLILIAVAIFAAGHIAARLIGDSRRLRERLRQALRHAVKQSTDSRNSVHITLDTSAARAQLDELVSLLKQLPESVFRDLFGDVESLVLHLAAYELVPATRTDKGDIAFQLRFCRLDELLAATRRALESSVHG